MTKKCRCDAIRPAMFMENCIWHSRNLSSSGVWRDLLRRVDARLWVESTIIRSTSAAVVIVLFLSRASKAAQHRWTVVSILAIVYEVGVLGWAMSPRPGTIIHALGSMRVVVCGDDGVGKSSLVTVLIKDRFVPNIEDILPPLTFPRGNQSVTVVDTSPQLRSRDQLLSDIRSASVIWLVFSDQYTMERVSLFWLPFLRLSGVNLPVILCQNKSDLQPDDVHEEDDEIYAMMHEFKEIESFIRCSAKEKANVIEAFYLCDRAVTHPLAPLFQSKENELKIAAVEALNRIFFVCDQDQTGFLSDLELLQLQFLCFQTSLESEELIQIHAALKERGEGLYVEGRGVSREGFLALASLYCERGRHETIWGILRKFHYTDSLSLDDKFLHPRLDVPPRSHVELSPDGYRFFVDLFTLFDKDNDGGLQPSELEALFAPVSGRLPQFWYNLGFPGTTVRNEQGYITLQGWLAQWAMTAFLEPRVCLEYLALLGYGARSTLTAVRVTKQARKRNPRSLVWRSSTVPDRMVFNCLVLGAKNSGKTTLLQSFLGQPDDGQLKKTAVNSIEMPGGKQCYLILQKAETINDAAELEKCDVVCLTYDSADPESFSHVVQLRNKFPELDELPLVFAALKADLDRQQQRCDEQPDEYTANLFITAPMHVSAEWPSSLNALFVQLVEAAQRPGSATPRHMEEEENDESLWIIAAGITSTLVIAGVLYRRYTQ